MKFILILENESGDLLNLTTIAIGKTQKHVCLLDRIYCWDNLRQNNKIV
ncbi:MAG: hypothetical protein NC489_12075 [Ruminococcus flavefaciens]|nr:hypothetical protein [Ruminococcus flavefaciens]